MALVFRELQEQEFTGWDRFCLRQKNGTVFHTSTWLRHRKEGELHISACFDGLQIIGGFPWLLNRRMGLKRVVKPRLTPYYGPVWKDDLDEATLDHVISGIIDGLMNFDVFALSLLPGSEMPGLNLPVPTRRRKIRTCLKYPGTPPNYSKGLNYEIRRASLKGVAISETDDPAVIYKHTQTSFARAGRQHPFRYDEFERLFTTMIEHNLCTAFKAEHEDFGVIGTQVLLKDNYRAYNIMSGINWHHKKLNAGSLMMAHSIEWARQRDLIFDFEGSSIESVFQFFMRFGPEVVTYPYHVYVMSRRVKWLNSVAQIFGRMVY
ncbi:MAG: GNAT family N-acetyltransferase [Balneolaceae bacterium]|nr:MAG: GNAT family N-acetyltransferase [Balneolaceae bacterium]